MFAAAFIGLTIFSLTLLAKLGAAVPEPLLVYGWRLFGFVLLGVGGTSLVSAPAATAALGAMTMLTAGASLVSA